MNAPAPSSCTVGFVTPPRWVSPSPSEFPALVDSPVVTQQCFPDLPDFLYTLDAIAAAAGACDRAARLLGDAGCAAVAMEGTPFAWAGGGGEAAARGRVAAMATDAGVPVVMAATAIVDALRSLDVSRVALCPTYYPPDWSDAWCEFVVACDLDVVYCRTMADEGLTGPIEAIDDYGWTTGPEGITAAVERVADIGADAIVVTGAGCRTAAIVAELEVRVGCPVVGADSALFWALAGAAGLRLRAGAVGALTEVAPP